MSRQVLREYAATQTRPQAYAMPFPAGVVAADLIVFQTTFHMAEDGPQVTAHLVNLLTAVVIGGKQVHDANIIASMLTHNVSRLLTHNTADFSRFSAFVTIEAL